MKEITVMCPICDREWQYYYDHDSELPTDLMLVCSGCTADQVPHLEQLEMFPCGT